MGAGTTRWAADGGTEEGTGHHVCTHPSALSRFLWNEWGSRSELPTTDGAAVWGRSASSCSRGDWVAAQGEGAWRRAVASQIRNLSF